MKGKKNPYLNGSCGGGGSGGAAVGRITEKLFLNLRAAAALLALLSPQLDLC